MFCIHFVVDSFVFIQGSGTSTISGFLTKETCLLIVELVFHGGKEDQGFLLHHVLMSLRNTKLSSQFFLSLELL